MREAQNMCKYMSHVMRKPVYAICKQQRCRSACASAQSDQRLCCSLPRRYNISSFYIQNFKILKLSTPGQKPRRQVFSWWCSYNTVNLFIFTSTKSTLPAFCFVTERFCASVCSSFVFLATIAEPSREIMVLFLLYKLIPQMRMGSHPVGLDVWFSIGPFVYFHASCVWTAKTLASPRGCAGAHKPSLVAYVFNTITSWAGSIIEYCSYEFPRWFNFPII